MVHYRATSRNLRPSPSVEVFVSFDPTLRRRGWFGAVALLSWLAAVPVAASPWFREITAEAGLAVPVPSAPYGDDWKVPDVMTAGGAFVDYDGDGDLDVLLTNVLPRFEDSGFLPSTGVRLFRQDGPARFTDVTAAAGVGHPGYGVGIGVGDYDNDGLPDLYFANYGQDYLYRNLGDGTFQDVTATAGIGIQGWSCSTAFLDYDRDGFLDIFVTQYVHYDPAKQCTDAGGRRQFCGPRAFPPAADFLLRNEGDGTFTDVSEAAGIRIDSAAGLGVLSLDIDEDGWQDIYVTNDSYANHFWINRGDGTFVDDAIVMGAAVNEHGKPEAGMGVVAADFDDDLDFDLFMTHLRKESNTFYRNVGAALGFEDVTGATGLGNASMPYTGFGVVAVDLELDGDLDLVVANGAVNRGDPMPGAEALPEPWLWLAEPNQVFVNERAGVFETMDPALSGELTSRVEMTRGLSAGDIDGDGDLDLLLVNAHAPVRLYRNDAPHLGSWLEVEVLDPAVHRDALGATVTVTVGDRSWLRTVAAANSYLSSQQPWPHFGLGQTDHIDGIRVRWPDGDIERFPGGAVNRRVVLRRGQGQAD
jgi:hypothetical protein